MAKQAYLGPKIRRLRMNAGHTQVHLAKMLGISPSYLNLIEGNHRPLTVPLLLRLAEIFQFDLRTFAEDDDAHLVADLREVFSDSIFDGRDIKADEIAELMTTLPSLGYGVLELYRAFRRTRQDLQNVTQGTEAEGVELTGAVRSPTEEVSDFIQERRNHFPVLEEAADRLRAKLPHGVDLFGRVREYLEEHLQVRVELTTAPSLSGADRRYSVEERKLVLADTLPPATLTFQAAHQVALLTLGELWQELLADCSFQAEASSRLTRVALANYFAAAVVMPYDEFLEAATTLRHDLDLLSHRFRASFEQVCHRLTSLGKPGSEGIPFHLVRSDIAGNISKRFSADGFAIARFGGACPRWVVHAAFLTPGFVQTQLSESTNGKLHFSVARTIQETAGGRVRRPAQLAIELGCEARFADRIVYADGLHPEHRASAVPIGMTCRLCDRLDCRERAFPPRNRALRIDENVRGMSFFAPPPDDESGATP